MSITAEIVARLEAEAGGVLRQVRGLAELSLLERRITRVPAAFVVALNDRPRNLQQGRTLFQTDQIIDRTYGIVMVDRRHADPLGGALAEDLEPVRAAVRDALLGWQPPSAKLGLLYAGGEVVGLREGAELWWTDRYVTSFQIQGGP